MDTSSGFEGRLARETARIRWAAWFGDQDLDLPLPAGWQADHFLPVDGEDIGEKGIAVALASPIGTPRIRNLARGRKTACIVTDDFSRPTPSARLLPPIIAELEGAGIEPEDILILIAQANHRHMMRQDLIVKVGREIVERFRIRGHFSWGNCRLIGHTSRGTPVSFNREFLASEVKILVGSIVPHNKTGFSGGAKMVLPGVASIETAYAWHGPDGPKTGLAQVASESRLDCEEAVRLAGVDCIVNVIPNSRRGIAGMVVGDLVEAHRAGVKIAKRVFATKVPTDYDVCILSSYPKDNELQQAGRGLAVWQSAKAPIVHERGTIVLAAACSEGPGFHSLYGPNMPLGGDTRAASAFTFGKRDIVYFMPGINHLDLNRVNPDGTQSRRDGAIHFTEWSETERWLRAKHGEKARVAVFPCATIQLPEEICL